MINFIVFVINFSSILIFNVDLTNLFYIKSLIYRMNKCINLCYLYRLVGQVFVKNQNTIKGCNIYKQGRDYNLYDLNIIILF